MDDDKQIATMFDEQIETKIATDGELTVKLISDEQTISHIEFAELMIRVRRTASIIGAGSGTTRLKDRSIAAEEKMKKMFMEGWADRGDGGEGIRSVPTAPAVHAQGQAARLAVAGDAEED